MSLSRRTFIHAALASFAAPLVAAPRAKPRPIRIDGCGGPGRNSHEEGAALDAGELADVRGSGLTAINLTVSSVGRYRDAFEETLKAIAYWDREIAANPDTLLRVDRAADLRDASRCGLIFGFQDTTPLGEDLDRVEFFRTLGIRIVQLTYNNRNLVGDGCLEPDDAGLSRLGRRMVEALNASRLVVDLSHSGRKTALEATASSKAPVVISHTGCAALNPVPRNKTDEELRAIAARGGVVGIYLMPFLRAEGQPMLADLIAHLEHAIDVAGEDHVGVGTDGEVSAVVVDDDFKRRHLSFVEARRKAGIAAPGESADVYNFLPDLNRVDRFEGIAQALAQRGHKASRIDKVLGANFARVFGEVWG
jgi:membrane dipeptidase